MKIFRTLFTSLISAAGGGTSNYPKFWNKFSTLTMTLTTEDVKRIWREADAVCFDVDSTVVREEGIDEFAKYCGKGDEVANLTREAMKGSKDFREMLKLRLEIMSPTESQIVEFTKKHPHSFTPGVEELIRMLHKKGVAVYLVSGGLRRIINPIAQKLGIPEENIYANRLQFKEGKYVGFDVNEPTSKQLGKAVVITSLKNKFGYKNLVMIGDGSTDAEAHPPADAFIGFGGNVVREPVKAKAKWFVTSFQELIDEHNKNAK